AGQVFRGQGPSRCKPHPQSRFHHDPGPTTTHSPFRIQSWLCYFVRKYGRLRPTPKKLEFPSNPNRKANSAALAKRFRCEQSPVGHCHFLARPGFPREDTERGREQIALHLEARLNPAEKRPQRAQA